jgi:hypothetical protein
MGTNLVNQSKSEVSASKFWGGFWQCKITTFLYDIIFYKIFTVEGHSHGPSCNQIFSVEVTSVYSLNSTLCGHEDLPSAQIYLLYSPPLMPRLLSEDQTPKG